MARPAPTQINCPNCGHPFAAFLEQLLDVGSNPSAKDRLLNGRVNVITCPNCGFRGMLSTPLMYHDASKQLAIVFVPIELNLAPPQREKIIGDMTNALMRALPEDSPKGYLLQPRVALTFQGIIDQVLEADGITREVIEGQRRKLELLETLSTEADNAKRDMLLEENSDIIDSEFITMMSLAARQMSENGDSRGSLRLLNIRANLLETTEAGRTVKEQEEAVKEVMAEVQALGNRISRESFADLVVRSAGSQVKIETLGRIGQQIGALDYSTFQLITEKINASSGVEKEMLTAARERLLEMSAEYERQARAALDRTAATLRSILQAPDIPSAIQANIDQIDEVFLQIVQMNLEEARRTGNLDMSSRLQQVLDYVMQLIQAGAPPEIQFINEMLSQETLAASLDVLMSNRDQVSPELVSLMGELIKQLADRGNAAVAERLEALQIEAQKMI